MKLSSVPTGANHLEKEDIAANLDLNATPPLIVTSNYAENYKKGDEYSLTITSCSKKSRSRLSNGNYANAFGTDCDTGSGTSGAPVWIEEGGKVKLYGIVSGQRKNIAEGGDFNSNDLSTIITTFDDSLINLYDQTK